MPGFRGIVRRVIEKSDIVLEVLDARFIEDTRNSRIENEVRNRKKLLVHVINKCDYADKRDLDKIKRGLENCVFVSAREHLGTTLLRQKIRELANKKRIKKPVVGVVGYPNVGKSALINALKGRGSAKTSAEAGYTKGAQYLRISRDFLMIDTPGIIPEEMKEKSREEELVLIGAKDHYKIRDPELAAIRLIETQPELIERRYGIKIKKDKELVIEDVALKLNMKKKGNLPDRERASRKILQDWIRRE